MKFKIGDSASSTKIFSPEDVNAFALISGDKNPIHLDPNFAGRTVFQKPLVHGFLYASMISEIIANQIPGPGSIYINQELQFKRPVYHYDRLTAIVVIEEIKIAKSIYILRTSILNNENEIVLEGRAVIKLIV